MVSRKQKTPKTPKVTKKQLAHLDKAEARKVAVLGMHMGLQASYEMSPAEIISWMFEHQDALVTTDIEACDADRLFRPGVVDYLVALQQHLLGEGDCPEWNEGATPDPEDVASGDDEPPEASPLVDLDDEDEDDPELVEFPDYDEQVGDAAPAKENKPMAKPTMRAATTTPPATFIRRGPRPSGAAVVPAPAAAAPEEPAELPAAVSSRDLVIAASAETSMVLKNTASAIVADEGPGFSADDMHALVGMVSDMSELVAEIPDLLGSVKEQASAHMDDMRTRMDVQGLHKKVDGLGVQLRELAATTTYLSNAVAMLVNFWQPLGKPYSHLADVPDPVTYVDDLAVVGEDEEEE
jgi:hypothetical protein